ncbi:hypothetical protein QBC39DRAFT_366219 [Podospora conica]|nr:hypothetical protein QBC39DRAFT_366219 [Schizothecium conicum]
MRAVFRVWTTFRVTSIANSFKKCSRGFSSKSHNEAENNQVPTLQRSPSKLVYPEPPTTNHNDLASFLSDAERSGLDPASTTYVGTHFEYTVASALSALGFHLRRVGGKSDRGIDLLGTWSVPSSPDSPLRVVIQCKVSKAVGPSIVRELEGTFLSAPAGWRGPGALGFLVADRAASKGIRDGIIHSRLPIGFIACDRAGRISQILWNQQAEEQGLVGMGVGLRYSASGEATGCVLTFNGKHLPARKARKTKAQTKDG